MKIIRVIAREIFDSRSWPTIQCQVVLENGMSVFSSVPSEMFIGIHETVDLKSGAKNFLAKSLTKAIENIEQIIAPQLVGQVPNAVEMDLKLIEIDGTFDKSRLGANALLAVSMALYRAEALVEQVELYELIAYAMGADSVSLPFPQINVINGGIHTNNNLRIQEFMIVPVGAPTFRSAFETAITVFRELEELLKMQNKSFILADEGNLVGYFKNDIEALDMLVYAIEKANNQQAYSCVIALDIAASQFYDQKTGLYQWGEKLLTTDELINFYQDLVSKYPIYSIEDGLTETDWSGWNKLTKLLYNKAQIVADDLFRTNIYTIAQGCDDQVATSVIIKPNQIGTITESLQAIQLSKSKGLNTIVSHLSSETEDNFIADLAVGSSAGQIKAGSCRHSEHLAKYNRLLAIEDMLTLSLFDT